jgi:hypothetical protein
VRTLTRRELNRALLARQLLLERASLPLPRALQRIGGIQDQYAPNAYLRLWSCLEGFERDALDRALVRRSVVQATLMRGTIHVVARSDYALFAAGIRHAGQEWWRRVNKIPAYLDMEPVARRARAFFAGTTRTRAEVEEFLRASDLPGANLWGFSHWVDLVRVPPAGTWHRRRADLFALAEEWVGPLDATEEDGLEHLVRRYLAAFGPAPRTDIASWAGLKPAHLAATLERMTLRRFRDEDGNELLDLARAPLPDPDTPAPVRFLPTWDAALLVHARRTGILPEEYRPVVFSTKNPPSVPTFLVDGAVAGTWRYQAGRVELAPFAKLDRAILRELRAESERLADLHRLRGLER